MLNDNKISEIKIIIDGLLKDIDSLSETEMISHLKWEEILMSASLISHKLNTLRIEQERNNIKQYLLREDANSQFDSNDNEFKRLNYTITQLKREMSEIRLNISNSFLEERGAERDSRVIDEDIFKHIKEQVSAKEPHLIDIEPIQPKLEPVQHEEEAAQLEANPILNEAESIQQKPVPEQITLEPKKLQLEERFNSSDELDFLLDKRSLMDISVPYDSAPNWMKDMPGFPVDDVRMAVTLNDKLFFIRELFKGDEDQYRLSMEKLDEFSSFRRL